MKAYKNFRQKIVTRARLNVFFAFVLLFCFEKTHGTTEGLLSEVQIYHGRSQSVAVPAAQDGVSDLDSTINTFQFNLGYIAANSFYVGGLVSTRSDVNSGRREEGTGFGAGLGYFFQSGVRARAFYRFSETYGSFSNGTGATADLGIWGRFFQNVSIGLVISHSTISFSRNSTTPGTSWTSSSTQPMLTMGYHF